ncbi:WD40-repeat-containing domain [Trinorchestia longiramus]|nr:WD40-repeat-containing domain [Trinorchestia longiramus]
MGICSHSRKPSGNPAQSECVSVAVHPSGSVLAVGTVDGHLMVVRADSGKHVATVRVCGSPVSPTTRNGSMYLYKSTREGLVYTRYSKMLGDQPLSAIDWAESGKYLQPVTSDYDLTFWSMRTLSNVSYDAEVQDEQWATQTCPLGYYVHGIWSGRRDSPIQVTVDWSPKGDLLAAGDTRGNVRLYRYPVLSARAGYHQYKVYTSYVSSVRFSLANRLLFTTGGTDASLIRQFRIMEHHNTATSAQRESTIPSLQHNGTAQYRHFSTTGEHNTVTSAQRDSTIPSLQHNGTAQYRHFSMVNRRNYHSKELIEQNKPSERKFT